MSERRMAVHLPSGTRCWPKPCAGGECPLHKVPACSSWHRWNHQCRTHNTPQKWS
ncbi:hypothetical protein ACHAW6_000467 [Cyclotella cf. meneghiniana]